MKSWIRQRQRIFRVIDRSPAARTLTARTLAVAARRHGADDGVLGAALSGAADRPAETTAEMIRWAGALAGSGKTPRFFRPSEVLDDDEQRRLRTSVQQTAGDDPHLVRQIWSLTPDDQFEELRLDVTRRLPDLLRVLRATGPVIQPSSEQLATIDTITKALAALDLQPFLVSGTLLGVVRDGAPMATDYDIDLGLLPGVHAPAAVAEALRSTAGYAVDERNGRLVITTDRFAKIDLFFHDERDGRFWHRTDIHEWWNTPFGLEQRTIDGTVMWIPDDCERYLDENYGPTWRRKVPFYDMSFDTPNREYVRDPAGLLYLVRRAMTALESQDRWAYESSARELLQVFGVDVDGELP